MTSTSNLGCFDALADDPIPEEEENVTLGFTKRRWLTDPRVVGAGIWAGGHEGRKVGHIIRPYIAKSVDPPIHDMLACRAVVYLSDPLGKGLYEDIKSGKIDRVSVRIDHDVQCIPLLGEVITGRKLGHLAPVKNARKPHCRITCCQSDDAPGTFTMIIPLLSVRAVPPDEATKTNPETGLQFPLIPADDPSMAAPVPPAAAVPPAATAPPAPPAQASADQPTPMELTDVAQAQQLAEHASKVSEAEARKGFLEAQLLKQRLAAYEKAEAERKAREEAAAKAAAEEQKKKAEEAYKQHLEKYKEILPDLGVGLEGEKKNAQLEATFQYLLQDPNAAQTGATQLQLRQLELLSAARRRAEEAEKKLADQQLALEAVKRIKGNGASQFAAPPPASPGLAPPYVPGGLPAQAAAPSGAAQSPAAAAAGQSAPQQQQEPPAMSAIEAQIAAERQKSMAATFSNGLLNPATLLRFPQIHQVSRDARSATLLHTMPQGGGGVLAREIAVQQSAGSDGPVSGQRLDQPLDPKVIQTVSRIDTGNPNYVTTPGGYTVDVNRLFVGQEKMRGATSGLSYYDQAALYNVAINRGIGSNFKPSNYLDAYGAEAASQSSNGANKRSTTAMLPPGVI